MNENNFYITLPSNTVAHNFFNNKTSHFFIVLPTRLELPVERWEVGLVEMSYPHTWHNIYDPHSNVTFRQRQNEMQRGNNLNHTVNLPDGFYPTTEVLLKAVRSVQPKQFKSRISLDRIRNRVRIILHQDEELLFSRRLAEVLGFPERNWFWVPKGEGHAVFFGTVTPDVHATMHSLYVYTNIVRDVIVGDSLVPLLRTVKTSGEDGEYAHVIFDKVHYIPLSISNIKDIEISICDDTGNYVHFQSGKVIVKLHFRKKKLVI